METKKQTALDWLLEEWPILESQIPPRIIDQAKAMEKEQMKDAVLDDVADNENMKKKFADRFEQYYNETYGQ